MSSGRGYCFPPATKELQAARGGGSPRGAGPPLRIPEDLRTRRPGPCPAQAERRPSHSLPASAWGSRRPSPLPRPQLTSGPLRLRGQRAFLQLQACASPRANFPTRAGPHNFGAPGSSPSEGRGLAPADTYRLLARSGPEPPRCVAASQRSTVETQVELHDWGAAGGASRGADRGAERPAAARTKRRRSGLRCSSPPGQPPGAAVSPQDRP